MRRFLISCLVTSTVFAQGRQSLAVPNSGNVPVPKHQESVRLKPGPLEVVSGKEGSPSRVKKPSNSKRGKAACEALSVAEGRMLVYVDVVKELGREGRDKKWECDTSKGESQSKCLEQLQSLREMFRRDSRVLNFLNGNVQKFKALCPEDRSPEGKVRGKYENMAAEDCRPMGEPKRCEDALFNLADLSYQEDQRKNIVYREKCEREPSRCEHDRRGQPILSAPTFAKGLAAQREYLERFPTGARRDVILYRTAFIYDLMGRSSDAFPLLMEISRNYPYFRLLPAAHLRIGESYFSEKRYDSAIAYYAKVDPKMPGNESILDLSLLHKAEALSILERHEEAADVFLWIAGENVNDMKKYREPTSKERKLMNSTEAAFLAIAQLRLAASKEITKQGGDTVRAYSQPTTKRYLDAVENYLAKYPNANEAPAMAYDRFLSRINGRDWSNAISDGNRLIEKWPGFDRLNEVRSRLEFASTQDSAKTDGPH